ncbi:MAG: class I SAM-dependent methyltransferase [Solirubrobacteraceae bacterium]|nr:class I SAM-dependent methyltransferase [Solirubrobacteraceae bacterium]
MDYTDDYDPDRDFDRHYTAATAARIAPWLRPRERVVELGCATGAMTGALVGEDRRVVAVDRSDAYLDRARERGLPGVTWRRGDLDAPLMDVGRADHVVLANVLHELADPRDVLRRIVADHLAPGGLLHLSLQNPRSIHRLVALEMGLIDDLCAVSGRGERYGTRRLWTIEALVDLVTDAGLVPLHREGIVVKPLPNAAMERLDPAVLDGFLAAGRHLPDHAAMVLLTLGAAGDRDAAARTTDGGR